MVIQEKYLNKPVRVRMILERKKAHLSMDDLALRADIAKSAISTGEKGGALSIPAARRLGEVLGLRYWELLERFYLNDSSYPEPVWIGEDLTIIKASETEEYLG